MDHRTALSRRFAMTLLAFVALLAIETRSRAELIYDNSSNNQKVFLTLPREFGDEITFAGSARTLTAMAFDVFGETNISFGVRARFRIYSNNGPLPAPPAPQIHPPGDLLYQSPDIPLRAGLQTIRIADLEIPVPGTITWTVEFINGSTEFGKRAGLQVYHPPVVGSSFKDYWVRDSDGFHTYILDEAPASFAARFEALPDPPTVLRTARSLDGVITLQVTGPIGTRQVIEVSSNLRDWEVLGEVSLASTSSATLIDTGATNQPARFYRARSLPAPSSGAVFLSDLSRNDAGVAQMDVVGPVGTTVAIDRSTNLLEWTEIATMELTEAIMRFEDPAAATLPIAFYRLRKIE